MYIAYIGTTLLTLAGFQTGYIATWSYEAALRSIGGYWLYYRLVHCSVRPRTPGKS